MMREFLSRAFGGLLLLVGLGLIVAGLWMAINDGRWRPLGASVFGVFVGLYGLGRLFPGQPPPLPIETGDPLMEAAFDRARREFARFERGLAEGRREALIKYAMKTGYADHEHVWALAHSIDRGEVVTSLVSETVGESPLPNERHRVPKAEVEDWILIDDRGRTEGGFTQIAMAKIYKRDKGYVPWPIRKSLADFADLDDPTLLG